MPEKGSGTGQVTNSLVLPQPQAVWLEVPLPSQQGLELGSDRFSRTEFSSVLLSQIPRLISISC